MNTAISTTTDPTIEAEQAVIGSLLLDPFMVGAISDVLLPDDFSLSEHRLIYRAMLLLHAEGLPTDTLLVTHRLSDGLQEAGGVAYLAALVNLTPTSIHAEHYAGIVREESRRRLLRATSEDLAQSDGDVDAAVARAEAQLSAVKERRQRRSWQSRGAALDQLYERLTGEANQDDITTATGLRSLDHRMGGLRRGDLVILGARPSVGKSSLAVTIAHDLAVRQRFAVLFFSLEMLPARIWEKVLSIETGLPWQTLTSHGLTPEQRSVLEAGRDRMKAAPLEVANARDWTVEAIRAAAKEEHGRTPLTLIVVDYLQLARSEGRYENRTREVAAVVQSLKSMALELGCTVLGAAQLNRESEHRPSGEPLLSELREGGDLEQEADVVLLLSRPRGTEEQRPVVADITVQVAKNRLGETGVLHLGFRGPQMQFVDMAEEAVAAPPKPHLLAMPWHKKEDPDGPLF